MYDIKILTDSAAAFAFYHSHLSEHDAAYGGTDGYIPLSLMPVTPKECDSFFFGENKITLGAYSTEDDTLIGIASCCIVPSRKTGYLSYICVDKAFRRLGAANTLCDKLESFIFSQEALEKAEAVFYNPVHLPWYIPNTQGDWHPCMPGVDKLSGVYALLKKRGWIEFATQNSYYREMADYEDKPNIAEARERLLGEGIELTLFDEKSHFGLPELFDNIGNAGWKATVLAHLDRPIVVAVDLNRRDAEGRALVVSYTGPLSKESNPAHLAGLEECNRTRGGFCGIGTRTEYRGRGIGKPVFCSMCAQHRDGIGNADGASFMSLYTGTENPARKIYESAGFRVVRSFADMRKTKS